MLPERILTALVIMNEAGPQFAIRGLRSACSTMRRATSERGRQDGSYHTVCWVGHIEGEHLGGDRRRREGTRAALGVDRECA